MGRFTDARFFESKKQDWETPLDLFIPLDNEFHFTLDVAANEKNKKCDKFISKEQDAMIITWGNEICWLNPPYGEKNQYSLSAWVKKARQEADNGSTVVMLIPARTNTNWFHDICLKRCEIRFIKGRPKFVGAIHGLPQPLCLVIMKPTDKTNILTLKAFL